MSCSLKEEHHQVLEVVEDGTGNDQRGQYGERKVKGRDPVFIERGMVTEKLQSSSATQDLRYDGVRNIPLAPTLSLETGIAYQF